MYVPTIGPATANIMLVGEAPGEEEHRLGEPFLGPAGRTLNRLLSQAGLSRHECLIANVAREKPPGNKISFFFEDSNCTIPKPIMKKWIATLKQEIEQYRPNIVVALGATALWALTGLKGIKAARGCLTESTLVPGQKVIATYHPQAVNYEFRLHFETILDLRKAAQNSKTPDLLKDTRSLYASPSKREFIDFLQHLYFEHEGPISFDVETANPGAHIDILGFAPSAELAYSFQLIAGGKPRFSQESELEVWQWAAKVLSTKPLIMQNGLYDIAVLWHNNHILCRNFVFDTLVAAHVCWPETPRDLGFLSSICLNVPLWKHQSQEYPTLYNAQDAANTFGCYEVLQEELIKGNHLDTFNFEMSQVNPAIMLQLQGLYVNSEVQEAMKRSIEAETAQIYEELTQELGQEINFNSHQQVKDLLYIDMGLPVQYIRRKSINDPKKITANAEALEKLSRITDNPTLLKILNYKKLKKLYSSFIDIEVSPSNRVHTSYNITGATMAVIKKHKVFDDEDSYKSFGRWSSSKSIILPYGSGNLQNIPREARKMYTAPQGYSFVRADYVQAEAVVVAYLINDQRLMSLFEASFGKTQSERDAIGADVHKYTASMMFSIPMEKITKEQRSVGKTIRHATNYSAGPGVVAARLKCSMGEAKKLLSTYHNICPQLRIWHREVQNQLQESRTLTNLLGRKHRFLSRWPSGGDESLFRSAYSYIPQSTVGDLLNKSLVQVYNEMPDWSNLVLQLHDALYVIVPDDKVTETIVSLRELMLYPLKCKYGEFTIDVDFGVGKSWGEIEAVDFPKQ